MLSAISRRAPRRPNQANNGLAAATIGCRLLAVVFQHLIAGRGQLGTILLQASQNGEIALIDHRAAETLHVARARLLLVRRAAALLGDGTGGNRDRQQGEWQEKFMHRVPSFSRQRFPIPAEHDRDRLARIAIAANRSSEPSRSA